jgi:hypothetical protein
MSDSYLLASAWVHFAVASHDILLFLKENHIPNCSRKHSDTILSYSSSYYTILDGHQNKSL